VICKLIWSSDVLALARYLHSLLAATVIKAIAASPSQKGLGDAEGFWRDELQENKCLGD